VVGAFCVAVGSVSGDSEVYEDDFPVRALRDEFRGPRRWGVGGRLWWLWQVLCGRV
jgi:hypothetical protein